MSLAPYSYRPATPPEANAVDQLRNITHSRNTSAGSSYFNDDASPESSYTTCTTPSKSPVLRQHGPTLLPKIRPQDAAISSSSTGGPKRNHRRMLSTSHTIKSFTPYTTSRPSVQRSVTEPLECATLISPVSSSSSLFGARAMSTFEAPISMTASHSRKPAISHSRSISTSSVDESVLSRYGYPTYRQLPVYSELSQCQPNSIQASPVYMPCQPPMPSIESHDFVFPSEYPTPVDMDFHSRNSSMTPPPSVDLVPNGSLLTYLTEPTQPINLVRQLNISPGRGLNSHFWWDIRNIRSWDSFSLDTMSTIPGLLPLLNFGVDTTLFPQGPSSSSTITPASESDLANIANKIYFPRVNAAIQLSQGTSSLSLYQAPPPDRSSSSSSSTSQPHFLANYTHDADRTLSGLPRGRVVGLVKSFDRWNTGMRHESPARKVDYLAGLAHLQKCMRDHSCRYGFILTEIELVCVRAGCDENGQPYFGYLEVGDAVATKNAAGPRPFCRFSSHDDGASCSSSSASSTPEPVVETPLTVTLALYYMLMLAKATPLPGQPGSFMDVGGPGALTRQRIWDGLDVLVGERGKDGKDKWIPEPQMGEKREAKRIRGWVWPMDPWHKREGNGGGKRGPRRASSLSVSS